jgi:hypothetical protein
MNIKEQFDSDMLYNSDHPLFTMDDDDILGKRHQGGYSQFTEDQGHQCRVFIFDNGHRYLFDIEDRMLYKLEPIPADYFIHKHLQKVISDFSDFWELTSEDIRKPMFCNEYEIDAMPLIRLLPFRENGIVKLTNILIPFALKHKGLGKLLIKQVLDVCQRFKYRLVLLDVVDSFSESLKKRNAKFLDYDTIEITSETILY